MITLVCYTCACMAVCVNVCTPRRAGGSPVHASSEPSSNLQYNAIGQITLVVAVCLQEDSCQIVSRLPGKHSLPSSTPTHHPTGLPLSHPAKKTIAGVPEWVRRYYSGEMDRQVETDRLWNPAGNIGSSLIMRPANLNASRLSSTLSRLTTEAAISSQRKDFRVISYP